MCQTSLFWHKAMLCRPIFMRFVESVSTFIKETLRESICGCGESVAA
ncbi:hypothetical protein MADA3029_470043 [Vibrio nigripulchritudo MADA3029]|nr:hypothetical protein VIBNIFTn2_240011 [Vibrio nigripulchritudo FTn2]CCN45921.1 hypothetical protein VIBNIMADA3020_1140054 [Vibrio nigripulchritudo MADA3020]CCN56028.1 hypothetical protein VIBNIMADA3021_860024 [Vibrio nigripulchritudo MADA3021]CCN59771.1 hypothetical protein MADA3029_470043 [Vibrio nigripulchritudo MADA3029]CCN62638.1 hypothetical protein VIBNIPon4_10020 [Vibrio nigripulchritudo POn4]CCN75470.1 hypothetical protein VIBNISO65_1370011 [Vibrio nigripulchritudo SO65]CCN87534.1 